MVSCTACPPLLLPQIVVPLLPPIGVAVLSRPLDILILGLRSRMTAAMALSKEVVIDALVRIASARPTRPMAEEAMLLSLLILSLTPVE